MIIDCHGHYTTAPRALEDWRNRQIEGLTNPARTPRAAELRIGDDELRESIEKNQLKQMRERGADLTIFSPRASFMAHHIGGFETSATWAAICNELIYRIACLFPAHFIGCAMLPQSPGVDPKTCLPELERCVNEYGFVTINLNPDPSGGHWKEPPLSDRHWYPIYEKLVNILFASEMIGAVRGIDPQTGHHYDDTKRYIEATPNLGVAERRKVYEENARRVYPRLDAVLRAREI